MQLAAKKYLIDGSVLDVGCGCGRFVPLLGDRDYLGIDISPLSVGVCKKNFPDNRFEVADIVKWTPDRVYDNIFTWTVLEHIPPEVIGDVVEKLKAYGRNVVAVEPIATSEKWAEHCFPHDYEKYFGEYREKLEGVCIWQWSGLPQKK